MPEEEHHDPDEGPDEMFRFIKVNEIISPKKHRKLLS